MRKVNGKSKLLVASENMCYSHIGTTTVPVLYHIPAWLALTDKDYKLFNENFVEKGSINAKTRMTHWDSEELRHFLELQLMSHIEFAFISLAGKSPASDWYLSVQPLIKSRIINYKTSSMSSPKKKTLFNIYFTSNMILPELIGVGNKINLGYGTVIKC